MTRKKIKPFYEKILITDIGAEGKSVARAGDKVVFTTHAIPGDLVDLQVTVRKKRYEEARVVRYHQYSPDRVRPFCGHFELCGGCKWQFLPYHLQLYHKQKQVEDQLRRIGKLDLPVLLPILGSEHTTFYRNKLEFTFTNNRWLNTEEMQHPEGLERNALGFHIPGMYDKVFAVSECWLQPEPSNKIRNFIYEYAIRERLSFFDLKAQTGLLRSLIIRTSATGEVMVIVSFYEDHPEKREALLLELHKTFPEITSLLYAINTKGNDTLTDQNILTFKGKDHIMENMDGLSFKVGPKSFYQTNSLQAAELYRLVKEFAALTGKETVYDLYSGTGTIALYVAGSCKKVIGIEYVPEAIEDACINMELNKISNALFFAGDIRRVMDSAFVRKHGLPDLIITDPPRSGMHEDVITAILEVAPEKIVYVSCNPATQARDLALMSVHYQIEKIRPVDMFPHTHHVENVVLLVKRTN